MELSALAQRACPEVEVGEGREGKERRGEKTVFETVLREWNILCFIVLTLLLIGTNVNVDLNSI